MADPETITIKVPPTEGNNTGHCLINKADYDSEIHELVDGKKSKDDAGKGNGKKGKKSKDDAGKDE